MDLKEMRQNYINEGYDFLDASAKVCQDIILAKISKSSLNRNITIKGGVVMHNISKDSRRATRDLDLDFIKYSLDDKSIKAFIEKLNYPKQDEYCFDLNNINENVVLLINSKEQIFTEKLKSLLKFGFVSTRYKDIFDFYYLINNETLDKDQLLKCFNIQIFQDESMKDKNMDDVTRRLNRILHNKNYLKNLNTAKNNRLELPIDDVVENVLAFFKNIQFIEA